MSEQIEVTVIHDDHPAYIFSIKANNQQQFILHHRIEHPTPLENKTKMSLQRNAYQK